MLLKVRRRDPAATDAHGNPTEVWGTPAPWDVRGLAPGAMVESFEANRDASAIAWTVYADKSRDVPEARDLVIFGDDEYVVDGEPKDWTLGPWVNPQAGVVVELRRVEG